MRRFVIKYLNIRTVDISYIILIIWKFSLHAQYTK